MNENYDDAARAVTFFETYLPPHDVTLHLVHNENRVYHQTVAQYIESDDYRASDFVSPEEMAKAIETNEVWEVQWYPNTPVGFNRLLASTLTALIQGLDTRGLTSRPQLRR